MRHTATANITAAATTVPFGRCLIYLVIPLPPNSVGKDIVFSGCPSAVFVHPFVHSFGHMFYHDIF